MRSTQAKRIEAMVNMVCLAFRAKDGMEDAWIVLFVTVFSDRLMDRFIFST
jgi:hypothetical protein